MKLSTKLRLLITDLIQELIEIHEQGLNVPWALFILSWVLLIQIKTGSLNLVECDTPGLIGFDSPLEAILLAAPPGTFSFELFDSYRLTLVVALGAFGVGVFVEPDFLGGRTLGEKEKVGVDAGVWAEDSLGKPDNCVQVTLGQEGFLDAGLHAFTEERAVRKYDPGTAAVLQ